MLSTVLIPRIEDTDEPSVTATTGGFVIVRGYMEDCRIKYKEHYGIEFGNEYEIHHIDGNRNNNDISNLVLLPKDVHSTYHRMLGICKQDDSKSEIDLKGLDATYGSYTRINSFDFYLEKMLDAFEEMEYWLRQKYDADKFDPNAYLRFKEGKWPYSE